MVTTYSNASNGSSAGWKTSCVVTTEEMSLNPSVACVDYVWVLQHVSRFDAREVYHTLLELTCRHVLVDPNAEEEALCSGFLSFTLLSDGKIAGMSKRGKYRLSAW